MLKFYHAKEKALINQNFLRPTRQSHNPNRPTCGTKKGVMT